jgi:hypothetical protein
MLKNVLDHFRGERIHIPDSSFRRYLLWLRLLFSLGLCAAVGFYVYKSIHWQLMADPAFIRYINFLMDHGWVPYRDIIDVNLPGSFLMDRLAVFVFGSGDLAWRFYDLFLLAILIAAFIVISMPYDWFAGLYAGVVFVLIHGSEGPWNAGQREQAMVTLMMVGYAFLFTAMRRQKPLLLLPFGFIIGLAASIKPTVAPLGLILLLMAALALRRRNIKPDSYLVYGLLGLGLAVLINLGFLYKYHAFGDFVAISKRFIPYYATIGNSSLHELFSILAPKRYLLMLILAGMLILISKREKDWENWERITLALGILFGALSFVIQRKDFEHHLYPFLVFMLLWSSIEFGKAWQKKGWIRAIGLACFAFGVLVYVPSLVFKVASTSPTNEQPDALKRDLDRLGGVNLQHQVQCFDMVTSCFSTLYRSNLLPYSAYMGDYVFFGAHDGPPSPYYQNLMWDRFQKDPPKVVVLTNEWLGGPHSFNKLKQWPQMDSLLDSAYSLEATRTSGGFAYRIYVLKNNPVAGSLTSRAVP